MTPADLAARLAALEARGQALSDNGRRAALNAIAGKRFPGHAVTASSSGVRVFGPRAGAVAQRIAGIGGKAAVKEVKEGLR